jgi:hypothetical protein
MGDGAIGNYGDCGYKEIGKRAMVARGRGTGPPLSAAQPTKGTNIITEPSDIYAHATQPTIESDTGQLIATGMQLARPSAQRSQPKAQI